MQRHPSELTQGRAPSGKCVTKLRGLELSCEKVDRGLGQVSTLYSLQAVVMVMGWALPN